MNPRLISLDVFRGFAITAMIVLNNPGSWNAVYPWLKHAEWDGCNFADLIFPFFLFIVGVSLSFSLAKYDKITPKKEIYQKIIYRATALFFLGLMLNTSTILLDIFLNHQSWDTLENIRIMGVLQRIGLTYLLTGILILNLSRYQQWCVAITLLLGYWLALNWIPIPHYGAGNLSPGGHLGAYLDRLILGQQHLLKGGEFDPEGLFSTLPATVNVLLGYFIGNWLKVQPIKTETTIQLVKIGLIHLIIGYIWSLNFPLNKQLWTSSYVIFTTGYSLILLALCYHIIEVKTWRKIGFPLEVMGMNAIFVFVASGLVTRILLKTHISSEKNALNLYTWLYQTYFESWLGGKNGSLLFAMTILAIWWLILYQMYQRRWFLKL